MEGLFGSGDWLYIILIGVIVGVLARLLKPGKDSIGLILTTLLGIAGALLAGRVGPAPGFYDDGDAAGFIGALAGEIVFLLVGDRVQSPRPPPPPTQRLEDKRT